MPSAFIFKKKKKKGVDSSVVVIGLFRKKKGKQTGNSEKFNGKNFSSCFLLLLFVLFLFF